MSYTIPVPWTLLVHRCQYMPPNWTTDNGFPVHANHAVGVTQYPCNVQEDSSNTGMTNSRVVGSRNATLLIPFEFNGSAVDFAKDGAVLVTGQGYPVAGRLFRITGISRNVAGANCLQAFDIEEES
jgi:hypothetical protein